ncbi:hypothetical protein ACTHOQ_15685 [Solibacillus silvestris]|uniref:hypothetical protein n=1 Tax=Solibacillus silvestris TaxID=76853 RepID=UPI003F8183C1
MLPKISQVDYEIRLVTHLLSIRFLRPFNGKLATSRAISDDTYGFETEDSLCREWLLSIYNSYSFYEGFETLESCLSYIHSTNYDNDIYRIVKFSDQYYAVVYENSQHQQVIGKEVSYFTRNNLFLSAKRPPSNLMIKDRHKLPPIPLIYYELNAFDPALTIYKLVKKNSIDYMELPVEEAIEYAVLLGVSFKDIWYKCDSPHAIAHNRAILNLYFAKGHNLTLFGKYSKAIAINPFQRLVYLQKGRIEPFQMDVEDIRAQQRLLPYREVRRFHENIRTRPVNFSINDSDS